MKTLSARQALSGGSGSATGKQPQWTNNKLTKILGKLS